MTRIPSEAISEGVRVAGEDFARRCTNALVKAMAPTIARIRDDLSDKDFQSAKAKLASLHLGSYLPAQDRAIRGFVRLCAVIGASALGTSTESQFAVTGEWPDTVDKDAVNHVKALVKVALDKAGSKVGNPLVDAAALAYRMTPNPVQNAAPLRKEDNPFDPDWLATQINRALRGEIKRVVEVSSNLAGTRVSAYGMLHEATVRGVARYRVDAVLDERTTDICQHMHGKMFPVSEAYQRTQDVLQLTDVERIKRTTPFLSLEEIRGLSNEELQDRGFSVPPFHFQCRSVVTLLDGTEPPLVAVPGKQGHHTQAPMKAPSEAPPTPGGPTPPEKAGDASPPPPAVPVFPKVGSAEKTLKDYKTAFPEDAETAEAIWGMSVDDLFKAAMKSDENSDIRLYAPSAYTGNLFTTINGILRKNKKPPNKFLRNAIATLDDLIAESVLEKPRVTYRGLTPELAAKLQVGKVFQDDAFLSTTLSHKVARSFTTMNAPTLMQIYAPPGTNLLPAYMASLLPYEWEMLLPRGTQLRVIGTEKIKLDGEDVTVIKVIVHAQGEVLTAAKIGAALPAAVAVSKATERPLWEGIAKYQSELGDFREAYFGG